MEKTWKKKINPTLFDLCFGIVLYGVVAQAVVLIISRDSAYSIGLWVGILLAVAGAIHMYWALSRSLDMASKDATRAVGAQSIVRYFILVIVVLLLALSGIGNPITAIFGYLGMKPGAYLQPFTRKLSAKIFKIV